MRNRTRRIAIGPVSHRRIDEFRIRNDHHDVVIRANNRAAGANLLHLAGDPGYLDPISDRDRSFGQNHQAADEIARDVLQTKADAHADRARENRQRAQVNAGIFKDNQNANYEHDVADDLGDGVLEGAIQSTLSEDSIKKKALRPRGDPKNCNQESDKQKNLEKAQRKRLATARSRPAEFRPR